jgi:hypothetical protein
MSKPKLPPGLSKGDYVALTPAKFGEAYATLIGVTAGTMPSAPDFPAVQSWLVHGRQAVQRSHRAGQLLLARSEGDAADLRSDIGSMSADAALRCTWRCWRP